MPAKFEGEMSINTGTGKSPRSGVVETSLLMAIAATKLALGAGPIDESAAEGAPPRDVVGDWLLNLAKSHVVP
jgi:hypothetical protein